MRKRFNGGGRNKTILLRRMQNYGSGSDNNNVEEIVSFLQSSYPDYRRVSAAVLSRNVQAVISENNRGKGKGKGKRKRGGEDRDSESESSESFLSDSVSESRDSGGQVSEEKVDLFKSALREKYCKNGSDVSMVVSEGDDESGQKRKKEKKGVRVELAVEKVEREEEKEGGVEKGVVAVENVVGEVGRKEVDVEKVRKGGEKKKAMFKDFGGMGKVLEDLKYNVLIPLRYPELLNRLKGLRAGPPTGILLHGPPGCGKTMLAQAIANEAGVEFYQVSAPEFASGVSGQSEEKIRQLFTKARETSPSIIFIDEIDAIAERRESAQKGMETRIVTQLLKCMDSIQECDSPMGVKSSDSDRRSHIAENGDPKCRQGHVLVIAATNRPNSLDRALRRPGRFTWEIELSVPNEDARFEILSVLTGDLGLQSGLDLRKIARDTHGFVGADLEEVVSKASLLALQSTIDSKRYKDLQECGLQCHEGDWWKQLHFNQGDLDALGPKMDNFEAAVKCLQPSLKREGFSTVPDVKWEDVGGLDTIRQEFQTCIVHPIKCPEDYEVFADDLPGGYLLYGPPGCGKTLIAKAVANEAGASFIYVKGPELMDKYVGESELAVRKLFGRARTCSPCILFFDEVDALTANHGESSGVADRILKQLLIELDGAEERRGVYVIGATNRPELIDRALLRPGRFEELLYVPLPGPDERGLILKSLARKRLVDSSVDLVAIAKSEACEHLSGADLASLIRKASRLARQEMQSLRLLGSEANSLTIKASHFEKALMGMTPSVNKRQRDHYGQLSKSFSAAK